MSVVGPSSDAAPMLDRQPSKGRATPVISGVKNATLRYDLPTPAVAVRNLVCMLVTLLPALLDSHRGIHCASQPSTINKRLFVAGRIGSVCASLHHHVQYASQASRVPLWGDCRFCLRWGRLPAVLPFTLGHPHTQHH